MTTIALPPNVRPTIVCPPWCTVATDEHIADLGNWEGLVIHWSAEVAGVRHSEVAYPDGTTSDEDVPLVNLDGAGGEMTLDAAEAFAQSVLAAVREARA